MSRIHVDKNGKEIGVLTEKLKGKKAAAFEAISKKAILVNMSRTQLSNLPFDMKLSNEVCASYGVKNNAYIQIHKCIFNPEYLTKLRSLINDALLVVWNSTRPWDNVGFRLLPMEYYDDFTEAFAKIKDDFEEAKQTFINNYDVYVKEAKRDLGKVFNNADYPDKADLNSYFNLEIQTSKFPEIDDIRLNLTNEELIDMQNDVVEKYDGAITSSIKILFEMINKKNAIKEDVLKCYNLIKTLNVDDNTTINMELITVEESIKLKFGDIKEKETKSNESEMIMDDIDGFDEDNLTDFSV